MDPREKKVKKEQREIKKLLKLADLDEIKDTSPNNIYTFSELGGQKRQLIRMMILDAYLQADAKMSILVANFFFHHCLDSCEEVEKITTSKKFTVFSEKILDEMPFLRKVTILKSFITVPGAIIKDINKLNDLRNAIAHALVPENLINDRIIYKGKSIFTLNGIKVFGADTKKIMSFLQKHFVKTFKDNNTN